MPTVKVYNMDGEALGEVGLSDAIFGIEPNAAAMHEAVKNHLSNRRQGTQSALTRAEVSGGGRKPYRQKGTGRARHVSTRVPHYTHGGVAFAPKPRDYSYALNKKLKRLALKSALSRKAQDNNIYVIDDLKLDEIKTKEFKAFLAKLGIFGKALVVMPEVNETIIKSSRNIPGVNTTIAKILSTYDVINGGAFIVDKAALAVIEEVYA
ncbi:MAG: 50S ribosomal protein L4 [Clostridiales bacterium]|nr:50S ribosomal protein L4 [Clostridiales bacterium]